MPTMDLVYPPVIGAARLLFRALGLRIEVEGADRMPPAGPVVLASNHVSFLDFTLVGLAAQPRYVRFLTRHDVFANPFAGPFMRAMRHIPVDREAPAAAYLTARRMLREGEVVGIFPPRPASARRTTCARSCRVRWPWPPRRGRRWCR